MSTVLPAPPSAPAAPDADAVVAAAVARARAAQPAWAALPPRERGRRMARVRRRLVARMDEVVATLRGETGKPEMEAVAHEVLVLAGLLRFYERRAPRVLRPRRVPAWPMLNKSGWKAPEPIGVVGVISPWNFPLFLPGVAAYSALFAGNAVVLKPSEVTPRSGEWLATLLREALPEHADLLQVVHGAGDVGAALCRGGVGKVAFIGSPGTGRRVMAACAERLVPVVMELGANDVAIVCDDADLPRAAAGVVWGAMANAGQACVSTERALVADAVYDRFAALVEAEVRALRASADGSGDVGRLIFAPQAAIIQRTVDDAAARGGRVLTGGAAVPSPDGGPPLYPPTLIRDADASMLLAEHETFGPVLPLLRVRDDEEAIRLANAGRYGLNATVWTGSRSRGRRIARRLAAGMVLVNDAMVNFGMSALPYGGVKESGFGRLQGDEGLLEFTQRKAVTETRLAFRREPFWFPYDARMLAWTKRITRWMYG